MKKLIPILSVAILAFFTTVEAEAQETVKQQKFYDSECGCDIEDNYHDNGVLSLRKKFFKDENRVEEMAFYPDRSLKMKRYWKNDKQHGTSEHFHSSGNLYYKEIHNMGEPEGVWVFHDFYGKKNMEIEHVPGTEEQKIYTYFSDGTAYYTQTIENGQVMEEAVLNEALYQHKQEEQKTLQNFRKTTQ